MRGARVRPLGLRARVTALFALGALVLSAALAIASYEFTRQSLLQERERTAVRAAYFDAAIVQSGLRADQPQVTEVLAALATGEQRRPFVRLADKWYGATAQQNVDRLIPPGLLALVEGRSPGVQRVTLEDSPVLVVGVPLPDVGASYYEVTDLEELRRTLALVATVLALAALGTTLAGASVGWWASRRVLAPLGYVAAAAGSIAAGDLSARVARDDDPDLDTLAVAFNRMVDEVSARSEADRRFAADVSHELRSPLQTLSAAASVLDRRRDTLDARTTAAVDLISAEVERFSSLVSDLLELAKSDRPAERRPTDVGALARSLVVARGLPADLVEVSGEHDTALVDPRRVEQILTNLLDNAARHGGGAVRVGVHITDGDVFLDVDDEGPGVPPEERDLVFHRFARGRAASARGGSEGTGLGLALVAQHAAAHRGAVTISDRPGGGARFAVLLPAAEAVA
jgi:two-component system sensor histidine kinase MtrB